MGPDLRVRGQITEIHVYLLYAHLTSASGNSSVYVDGDVTQWLLGELLTLTYVCAAPQGV